MKETTANAPGTNAEYAAQLARKIHEPYEHVLAAVEFYGRDPIRIKRFLFEKSDDGIISLIARLLGKPAEQISFLHALEMFGILQDSAVQDSQTFDWRPMRHVLLWCLTHVQTQSRTNPQLLDPCLGATQRPSAEKTLGQDRCWQW